MRFALALMILTLLVPAALAKDEMMDPTARGPAVGDLIPSDLATIDQDGKSRNFENLTAENGLVLVFFRSAKWCPFCKRQLIDIAKHADEITSRGFALATLSYDKLENIQRFVEEYDPGFTMLSDQGSVVIDAFGIRNEKYGMGHYAHGVPHPMIFIIGPDKTVLAKLAEKGYKKRPPVSAIVEQIDSLSPSKE